MLADAGEEARELLRIRRRRAVVVTHVHVDERGAGLVRRVSDSICSSTVIGTAGLSFLVGTDPVIATVMMHGLPMILSLDQRACTGRILDAPARPLRPRRLANADGAGMLHNLMLLDGETMPTLTLAQANQIVAKALEKAREMKIKPVSVVVLDEAAT